MSELTFRSDMTVNLIKHCAGDDDVIQAAQVSVKGENNPETVPDRLINSLMRHRHGVPFEHTYFRFYVDVPIFVARQWVKHRMSSLNERSGRYGRLLPQFYVPTEDRPMINEGTKMDPKMAPATIVQHQVVENYNKEVAQKAWQAYQFQLKYGIAEEMARSVLPVGIYTQFYWSLNARSLMNFLERRVDSPAARVATHPQWEIQLAAEKLEESFKTLMPLSHAAFVKYGRVAP